MRSLGTIQLSCEMQLSQPCVRLSPAIRSRRQKRATVRPRVIARAQNISMEDARTQVQQYTQQYRHAVDQAKQQGTQAADAAAKTVSRAALLGAISLLLGGLAGWFGGRMGAGEPTFTAGRRTTR